MLVNLTATKQLTLPDSSCQPNHSRFEPRPTFAKLQETSRSPRGVDWRWPPFDSREQTHDARGANLTGNAYRNFNYLIACSETGEALAIDPLDDGKCLNRAKETGCEVEQVLNTHKHDDHTGGNGPMLEAHRCAPFGHANAGPRCRPIQPRLYARLSRN